MPPPHFGIPELERAQAGLAGLGRAWQGLAGAPQTSRGGGSGERAIWGRVDLCCQAHPTISAKTEPASRSSGGALAAPRDGLKHSGTRSKTPQTHARLSYISSMATSANSNPKGILGFRRGGGTSPDGIDRLTVQAEKYTGTRLPRCGKACGLPYHEAPSSRRLYGGTKNHADDSKARPPDFFHPLLLHDDIRHATGSADALPQRVARFLRPSVRCDARSHLLTICLGNKVACLAARRSCPLSPLPAHGLVSVPSHRPAAVVSASIACGSSIQPAILGSLIQEPAEGGGGEFLPTRHIQVCRCFHPKGYTTHHDAQALRGAHLHSRPLGFPHRN